MKHAILIHSDGFAEELHGTFVLVQPTPTGTVTSKFRNGKLASDIVCNTQAEALEEAAVMLGSKRQRVEP